MASLGDTLADRTGWGEALFGALFFGATTSLSGIVITAVAAAVDNPTLAYSNAIGGIAAQTVAIAVADLFYRRGNLEHAAASLSNILFGCLLIALLTLVVLAAYVPPVTVAAIHPMSVVLVGMYVGGLVLIRRTSDRPMWEAVQGIVNALPETVTAIAAVRRGALTLAIAAILGGNCFDALNVAVGDIAYRGGSLYHAAGPDELFLTLASVLMTVVVVSGLLVRQGRGPVRVGFEGVLLLGTYASIVVVLSV